MFDIGKQQFLMLLLVVKAECGQERNGRILAPFLQQARHCRVNVLTVFENVCEARARQQTAPWSGMHLPGRVVIRVEQEVILIVEPLVSRSMCLEYETLEKPSDMSEVSLCWADIGH